MNAITKDRQKEFMARTLVGMVMHNQRELTDEECAVYNSILALIESAPDAKNEGEGQLLTAREMGERFKAVSRDLGGYWDNAGQHHPAPPVVPSALKCPECECVIEGITCPECKNYFGVGPPPEECTCRSCYERTGQHAEGCVALENPAPPFEPSVTHPIAPAPPVAPTDEERRETLEGLAWATETLIERNLLGWNTARELGKIKALLLAPPVDGSVPAVEMLASAIRKWQKRAAGLIAVMMNRPNSDCLGSSLLEEIRDFDLGQTPPVAPVRVTREEVDRFSSFLILESPKTFSLELSRWLRTKGVIVDGEEKP